MVCVALGVLGLIGVIVCCAVPRWKVSSFTGSNIVTAQVKKFAPGALPGGRATES